MHAKKLWGGAEDGSVLQIELGQEADTTRSAYRTWRPACSCSQTIAVLGRQRIVKPCGRFQGWVCQGVSVLKPVLKTVLKPAQSVLTVCSVCSVCSVCFEACAQVDASVKSNFFSSNNSRRPISIEGEALQGLRTPWEQCQTLFTHA
eukprot:1138177-Pelagomonas_calceolata.AAC.5